ncbi:MAG: hypothetical protein H6963_14705 [Chromatiaceae bacterium]|nr:hypothetical protein [Chromatiaceae bacterium]
MFRYRLDPEVIDAIRTMLTGHDTLCRLAFKAQVAVAGRRHAFVDKAYRMQNMERDWERVKQSRGAGGKTLRSHARAVANGRS